LKAAHTTAGSPAVAPQKDLAVNEGYGKGTLSQFIRFWVIPLLIAASGQYQVPSDLDLIVYCNLPGATRKPSGDVACRDTGLDLIAGVAAVLGLRAAAGGDRGVDLVVPVRPPFGPPMRPPVNGGGPPPAYPPARHHHDGGIAVPPIVHDLAVQLARPRSGCTSNRRCRCVPAAASPPRSDQANSGTPSEPDPTADTLAKLRRVLIATGFQLTHPEQPTPAEIQTIRPPLLKV
jgi:hypothetical protein